MILLLLILLPMTSGSIRGQMSGFIGENVLLPCNCSDDFNDLVWQREQKIVNGHSEDKINIDSSYINRTQLFVKIKGNCSLLLLNISLEDAGVYDCYPISKMDSLLVKNEFHVNLTVTEKENNPGNTNTRTGGESDTTASITVPILLVLGILAAVVLTLVIRKRHRRNIDTDLPAQQHMLETA